MEKLKGFQYHGVVFQGESGNQRYGTCPFCDGDSKFYVNKESALWDCKKCGKKGNFFTFLSLVNEANVLDMDDRHLSKLARDRGLPLSAFRRWEIGRHQIGGFSFPTRNAKGKVQDIRTYRLGQKVRSTFGCSVGLFGLQFLLNAKKGEPIYLCEGEWDTIAMYWLIAHLKKPGAVVGVPGYNTFKRDWIPYFQDRDIFTIYDKDDPGERGELIAQERLQGVANSIHYTHWSDKLPLGFDARDFIVREAIQRKMPKKCFKILHEMFKSSTRKTSTVATEKVGVIPKVLEKNKASLKEVFKIFGKWLYIEDFTPIEIALAVHLSTMSDGDPVWMFLVAPPGGAKSEIITSFNTCPNTFVTSSLTSKALISGASYKNGMDPSMIPELDGKTLFIKDFTSILSKRDIEKDEIFGTLRDAYDGYCSKIYGHGVRRSYKSHFSILAGVTPEIYEVTHHHQSLGERYLKYLMGSNLEHSYEDDIVDKAIENVSHENAMKEEIADVTLRFVTPRSDKEKMKLPLIPRHIQDQLIALARFGARLRGTISRSKYQPEMILSKPSAEVGSRLGKTLAKLLRYLAFIRDHSEVQDEDYNLIKKVALDTVSQRSEDIVRTLHYDTPTIDDTIKTKELGFKTKYTHATVARVLADMNMLDIVQRAGKSNAYEWTLSEYMRNLIKRAGLYTSKIEKERPSIRNGLKVKVKKRRKK